MKTKGASPRAVPLEIDENKKTAGILFQGMPAVFLDRPFGLYERYPPTSILTDTAIL
jgi:hypothetical protein